MRSPPPNHAVSTARAITPTIDIPVSQSAQVSRPGRDVHHEGTQAERSRARDAQTSPEPAEPGSRGEHEPIEGGGENRDSDDDGKLSLGGFLPIARLGLRDHGRCHESVPSIGNRFPAAQRECHGSQERTFLDVGSGGENPPGSHRLRPTVPCGQGVASPDGRLGQFPVRGISRKH